MSQWEYTLVVYVATPDSWRLLDFESEKIVHTLAILSTYCFPNLYLFISLFRTGMVWNEQNSVLALESSWYLVDNLLENTFFCSAYYGKGILRNG
jgi:hypothetical protein